MFDLDVKEKEHKLNVNNLKHMMNENSKIQHDNQLKNEEYNNLLIKIQSKEENIIDKQKKLHILENE